MIIHNTSHAPTRRESDVMHEIAHVLCEHRSRGVVIQFGIPCRTYDQDQEEEAGWLGACLQIPREGLVKTLREGLTDEEVAIRYGSSVSLARYRRNVTGVVLQMTRGAAWRSRPRGRTS
ncbi:MAG: ImmA/IrrE family metallo-endopeptidase [Longimicrobiales bacterium]